MLSGPLSQRPTQVLAMRSLEDGVLICHCRQFVFPFIKLQCTFKHMHLKNIHFGIPQSIAFGVCTLKFD